MTIAVITFEEVTAIITFVSIQIYHCHSLLLFQQVSIIIIVTIVVQLLLYLIVSLAVIVPIITVVQNYYLQSVFKLSPYQHFVVIIKVSCLFQWWFLLLSATAIAVVPYWD